MLKTVMSVILGYLVMAFLVFTFYTLLLFGLGAEGTYKPASWEPSTTWIMLSFVAGFIAAFAGGWVALRVSRDTRSATWLMVLIVILGILSVATQAGADPPTEPRPAEVSPADAASKSVPPLWVGVVQMLIGVSGVWFASKATGPRS
jgi:hypothetical protein